MRPSPTTFDLQGCRVPKPLWLVLASMTLALALRVFSVSKKLGRPGVLEWFGIYALRLATRSLGHAPAKLCIEFCADLPVEI